MLLILFAIPIGRTIDIRKPCKNVHLIHNKTKWYHILYVVIKFLLYKTNVH